VSKVRKAVITAAGRGTRQYPASSAVDKEMFPLVDRDGLTKPVIQIIGEEAISAGIEALCIITPPNEETKYREYFRGISENLLPSFADMEWALEESRRLEYFRGIMSFRAQSSPEGFGHAVHCARDWVGDEPFLLLLGDHVYISEDGTSCAAQLTAAWETGDYSAVTAVQPVPESQLSSVGVIRGAPVADRPDCYEALKIIEKPSCEQARSELTTPGLPDGHYLGHFGMHVFSPAVFDALEQHIRNDIRDRGEFQLTSAQEFVREKHGNYLALDVRGRRYDTGIPYGLMETQLAVALNSVHRAAVVDFLIRELARHHTQEPQPVRFPPRQGGAK